MPLVRAKPGGDVVTVEPLNLAVDVPPLLFQLVTKVNLDLAAAAPKPAHVLPDLPGGMVAVADVDPVTELAGLVVQPEIVSPEMVVVSFFEYPAELVVGTNGGVNVIVAVRPVQLIVAAGAFLADATPPVNTTVLTNSSGATAAMPTLMNFLFKCTCPP